MTPLFAATQASQPGGTQVDQTLGGDMASGALRATQQAMAFTPTQGYSEYTLFVGPLARLLDNAAMCVSEWNIQVTKSKFHHIIIILYI